MNRPFNKVVPAVVLALVLAAPVAGQILNKAEYFIDTDPGVGNGTPVTITPGATINTNFNININALSTNFHTVNFRVRDSNGKWSHFQTRTFLIIQPLVTIPPSVNLTKAEYFLDNDPGLGNGVNIAITTGPSINQNFTVPITSLSPGFHCLNIRARDDKGRWALFATRTFYIVPPVSSSLATSLKKAEYYFDHDPGPGNATALPITSGSPQSNSFALPLTALTTGYHVVGFRYQDNLGRWSHFAERTFFLIPSSSLSATNVKKMEYFIDSDPGIGLATNLSFTPAASIDQLFALDLSGVGSGAHKLFVRAKDNQGFWSAALEADFTILACTPPPAPTSPGASRCNTGTVTLTASGATSSNEYRWYADATTLAVLFTGPSYTTPSLSATTTYYASVFDPSTLCESPRTAVTAGIISAAPPLLNVTGSVTICQGNSIVLSAPGGFTDYAWSTGATTQQIIVSVAGNYTATVGNGTCQSAPSLPANINVALRPAKPSVTSTGALCAGQSVTLNGPPGFASYTWSNGATTQQTVVTLSGSYTLMVGDASGCNSQPSDPVVLKSTLAKPSIFAVGSTTVCEGQSVTLFGPTGMASYLWSSGATTQQLATAAAGNYTLQVTDSSGCVSPISDPTTLVVNPAPAKPIITPSSSPTICLGQSVSLSGPAGFGYTWSTGATTQQIDVNQTGSYVLIVRDSKGCNSAPSDPMVVTAAPCDSSHPPAIQEEIVVAPVEGSMTVSLVDLLSDPDSDLDFSSLSIVRPLASGAGAVLDPDGNLTVNYSGTLFSGDENLTLEVCDFAKNCTRKDILIRVVGEVVVYNAVSPNGDGLNEVLFLEYVDVLAEAKNNRVRVFNRWGDVVYEAEDYNNSDVAFKGISTSGEALPTGTYFYRIDFKSGIPYKTGYISLRK